MAQVSGPREQPCWRALSARRLKRKRCWASGRSVSPRWSRSGSNSRHQQVRDHYREGMVMERWNAEERSRERFVDDRVTGRNNSLTLRNAQGERG